MPSIEKREIEMEKETRSYETSGIEIREDGDKPRITGHAALFNIETVIGRSFREIILPGAFATAIKRSDVVALWNHNPDYVLGRKSAKTLRLEEDDKGLYYEIDPPDTQFAKDLITSIKRGDVKGNSFGFTVKKDKWTESENEKTLRLREIEKFDQLYDISPVTFPAYPQTDIAIRSILTGAGIDFDRLAEIIQRKDGGLELQADDERVIEISIEILSEFIKPSIQVEGKAEGQVPIAILRRKLELLEVEGRLTNEITGNAK